MLRRLVPDTLVGRTTMILVVSLGLFHLWSIWIYRAGTEALLGMSGEHEQAERLVGAMHALEALGPGERERTAHALSSSDLEIHWTPASLLDDRGAETEDAARLRERLREIAPDLTLDRLRFGQTGGISGHRHSLLAALRLGDGSWVTFAPSASGGQATGEHDVLGSLSAMALGILLVSILLVRSITAPLRRLADAADRIGTDIATDATPETGPRELRRVAGAFNRMQARITRLIADRTQTLAAVSHDLKTPITRLRLRAAFMGDDEARRMVEADLDEMERMIDSALVFLRGESTTEENRTIDLVSVLRTLCDATGDAGHDVELTGDERAPLACRPLAVKRAFANLIDNAIKYGAAARVAVADRDHEVIVTIDDHGPGIPEDEREQVFEPFFRREASRNRETGGTGLGLTIARTTARAHGGEIMLANRATGGLRVTVTLPKPAHRG